MDSPAALLALRLDGVDHALEAGRDYRLGRAADCDLRLGKGTAACHCVLRVAAAGVDIVDTSGDLGTRCNGERITAARLQPGDLLQFGEGHATAELVVDDGSAALVPLPELRAAATARRYDRIRIQAKALRQDEQTLAELIAHELHRAPWLGLSLLVHAVLLLLLLWALPAPPPTGAAPARVGVVEPDQGPVPGDELPAPPAVVSEPPVEPAPPPPVAEPLQPPDSDAMLPGDDLPPPPPLPSNGRVVVAPAPTTGAAAGAGEAVPGGRDFQRTVSELRQSGLEIMFVFDSTGSMAETIEDTRSTIDQMLAVLHVLVPDARIGLVTFRDHTDNDGYVTRHVGLGTDFWRAVNFTHCVQAGGGGDLPEAVRAGLRVAFGQPWRPRARRVVVLAGDAPPHREDQRALLSEVRAFSRNGQSFVHTLITRGGLGNRDTVDAFRAIAEAGRGLCQDLGAHDRVLQRELTLAFGREFESDLGSVIAEVERRATKVDTQALDLVRRGGPDLVQALHRVPVSTSLWNALVRRPRRSTVELLVAQLADPETPEPNRHAIAAALQRVLALAQPPLDPTGDERPSRRSIERLQRAAATLPE